MKGLVKEFILLSAILIILYFLAFKTNLFDKIFSSITGFFSYVFDSKKEQTVSFEVVIPNSSKSSFVGKLNLEFSGNLLESSLGDFTISQILSPLHFKVSCKENCNLDLSQENLRLEGIVDSVIIENKFQLSKKDGVQSKIDADNIKTLNITLTDKYLKLCSSEMNVKIKVGIKELEQKLSNDCIEINDIIRVIITYDSNKIVLIGYSNSISSSFFKI
ncbi:MAG: hypothetical protein QXL82_02550 [Candidatus Aenigmatarchaeota archaeon]